MKLSRTLLLNTLLSLAACGGSSPTTSGGLPQNAFTGTLNISGSIPAGATNCLATSQVVFSTNSVDVQTVNLNAGDCLAFLSTDTLGTHRVSSVPSAACNELNASGPISAGNVFVTVPLAGPRTCHWEDLVNPPSSGGGTGGTGGGAGY